MHGYACVCWEERSKVPEYKSYVCKYKNTCIKYFKYDVDLLQRFFLESLKRFTLISSHDSSMNTLFPKKNLSLGWFLSWQSLRSITFAKNIKEITLGFTLELCVHIIYSTSETPTGSTIRNISSDWLSHSLHGPNLTHSVFMTQNYSLDRNTRRKYPDFQKKLLYLTHFSPTSHLPSLGANPSEAPLNASIHPPLQCQGSLWSLGCRASMSNSPPVDCMHRLDKCVALWETHFKIGESRQQPDAWEWGLYSTLNSCMTSSNLTFLCLGLHFLKTGWYLIVVKITWVNRNI